MKKIEFLDEVKDIVTEREGQHGKPAKTHRAIAELWSIYLSEKTGIPVKIDAADVAMMQIQAKVGRFISGQSDHMDTVLDIAGYAACAGEIVSERQ
nr:MAG TPA: hypothetical protein [Caudoviricetes sp.]